MATKPGLLLVFHQQVFGGLGRLLFSGGNRIVNLKNKEDGRIHSETAPICWPWLESCKRGRFVTICCRVPKGGGVQVEGGNWGTLRIPREDWGTSENIRED